MPEFLTALNQLIDSHRDTDLYTIGLILLREDGDILDLLEEDRTPRVVARH